MKFQAIVVSHSNIVVEVRCRFLEQLGGQEMRGLPSVTLPADSYEHARAIAIAINVPAVADAIHAAWRAEQ